MSKRDESKIVPASVDAPDVRSPEAIIALAVQQGTPVETMERLLAMRTQLRAEQAKEAFDAAMSELQGEMPVIEKSKIICDKFGKERYRYAPIDAIIGQTREQIARHGFSYAVTTEQPEGIGEVKVITTVKHKGGHSVDSVFRIPIDKDGYMSGPQKVGAALTFAKRYSFCNAFGIITGDEDNDANEDAGDRLPEAPVAQKTAGAPQTVKVLPKAAAPVQQAKATPQPKPGANPTKERDRLASAVTAYGIPLDEFERLTGKKIDGMTEAAAAKYAEAYEKKIAEGSRWTPPQPKSGGEPVEEAFNAKVVADLDAPITETDLKPRERHWLDEANACRTWGEGDALLDEMAASGQSSIKVGAIKAMLEKKFPDKQ